MKRLARLGPVLLSLALLVGPPGVSPASAAPITITESFKNTTAPGWSLLGSAILTENSLDAGDPANGWLRLTDTSFDQVGGVVYDTPIPFTGSLDVSFDLVAYGGGLGYGYADGIAFYLIDGSTATPALGGVGGALGYIDAPGGFLAVGCSEYAGELQIDGSEEHDYPRLTTVNRTEFGDASGRADFHRARVLFADQRISVWLDGDPVLSGFDVSSQNPAPATVKLVISAATGGGSNIHEVRNFEATYNFSGLGIDPTGWDFGTILAGGAGGAKTFTVTNTGLSDLEIGTLAPSGVFTLSNDGCSSATVAPGAHCTFEVDFSSSLAQGTYTGSVAIPSSAPSSPDTANLRGYICGAAGDLSKTVTSLDDDGAGTLRLAVNEICPGGTITFDAGLSGGTVKLADQLLVNKSLTVDGSSLATKITLSGDTTGDGTGDVRIFHFTSEFAEVTLKSLILNRGRCDGSDCHGGAVYNESTLHLVDCALTGNNAGGNGGAVYNLYRLTMTGSTLSNNTAGSHGGGVYNEGQATVTGCTVISNTATTGSGGGLYNEERLTVTDSTVSGNTGVNGGGICNYDTAEVSGCTLAGNTAGTGGGLFSYFGTLTVADTAVADNHASGEGGGIESEYTAFNLTGSTISGNDAVKNGGGLGLPGGTVSIANCTVVGNEVTGSEKNYGGGGICFFEGCSLSIVNCTITGNGAASPNATKSGIWLLNGTLNLGNSIVAANAGTYNFDEDSAEFESLGHNLSDNWNGLGGYGTDLYDDALLGTLADNGGRTKTIALLPGSPAIGMGDDDMCAASPVNGVDQRGVSRPQGLHCDIGAYEATFIVPPLATTGVASHIGPRGATLGATVDPRGSSTVVTFEYGLDDSYGSSAVADQSSINGTTAVPVSTEIPGLNPNAVYHFRVVAVNDGGTAFGADQTFTTTKLFSISGRVTTAAGVGLKGVTMRLMQSGYPIRVARTNLSGRFTMSNLVPGTFVLKPVKAGWIFTPVKKTVKIVKANLTGKNFTAAPK